VAEEILGRGVGRGGEEQRPEEAQGRRDRSPDPIQAQGRGERSRSTPSSEAQGRWKRLQSTISSKDLAATMQSYCSWVHLVMHSCISPGLISVAAPRR
jgi:hypothetical protein